MISKKCRVTDFYRQLNPLYKRLLASFGDWQRILNYEKTSQRDMPKIVAEFLSYMQENNVSDPANITETHLQNYYVYLEQRPNELRGGAISKNYIRKHLQAIRRFARYLGESGHESFAVNIKLTGRSSNVKDILLPIEIAELYEHTTDDPLGYRDRAMLGLYYGLWPAQAGRAVGGCGGRTAGKRAATGQKGQGLQSPLHTIEQTEPEIPVGLPALRPSVP